MYSIGGGCDLTGGVVCRCGDVSSSYCDVVFSILRGLAGIVVAYIYK